MSDEAAQPEEDEDAAGEAVEDEPPPPLLKPGNRPRWVRGGVLTGVGFVLTLAMSLANWGPRVGVPTVFVGVLVLTIGLLDLLGTFDDPPDRVAHRIAPKALAVPGAISTAGLLATWISVRYAVAGVFHEIHAFGKVLSAFVLPGVLITGGMLVTLVGLGLFVQRLGVLEGDRPLHKRHGFWLMAIAIVLFVPALGGYSLVDPWETHYGEVSREILARNDWISLWWVQENWFWSKPILDFWIQAISMVVFGVRYEPGQMLAAATQGAIPYPEWAMRMPIFVMTIVATYVLYRSVATLFGRRAGLLAGVALTTMPHWFFIAHQTMTDMPFVAAMTAALAFVMVGLQTDEARLVRSFEISVGRWTLRLSALHLALGAILLVSLPQIFYLLTRNVLLHTDDQFGLRFPPIQIRGDAFTSGSPGNCGLPGNAACAPAFPSSTKFQPALQALVWIACLAGTLYMSWGERRVKRIYFLAAWFCTALAVMGKGPVGLVLPVGAVLAHLVVERRYRELLDMEIASGILIVLAVAMPWFVAMFVRHGQPFVDRLIIHDMYSRAFDHVHDTNQNDDVSFRYYVWQLGYGLFPWVGLVPLAIVEWVRHRDDDAGVSPLRLMLLVVVLGFALFSYVQTKFHHYIFPIVPSIAVLVGVHLDRIFDGTAGGERARYHQAVAGLSFLLGAGLVLLVGRDMADKRGEQPTGARLIHLFSYNYERAWPTNLDYGKALWIFTGVAAVVLFLGLFKAFRRYAIAAFAVVSAGFTAWALDVYFVEVAPHWGQRDTSLAYWAAQATTPGPLLSYQQNWKGENFYSGNHLASFPSTGQPFRDYVTMLVRERDVHTMYFFCTPDRISSLRMELGNPKTVETLTPPTLNNKFTLVRATF
ncbi:MAG: glycosyltransferase family 39 protein [Polyangiaceae bacterium]